MINLEIFQNVGNDEQLNILISTRNVQPYVIQNFITRLNATEYVKLDVTGKENVAHHLHLFPPLKC